MEGENKLVLEIDAINKVNYCLVHNGIKIISSIKLINESDKIYRNLIVKVRFEPTFADGYTFEISFILIALNSTILPIVIPLLRILLLISSTNSCSE